MSGGLPARWCRELLVAGNDEACGALMRAPSRDVRHPPFTCLPNRGLILVYIYESQNICYPGYIAMSEKDKN